jgi:predicted Zn-dependent peptidase
MNRFGRAVALVAALASPALAAERPEIRIVERTLPNGMRFLFYENHESPTVMAAWVAHVGSANEREGITGISHLFEHMMFKGTHVIGTKNYLLDAKNIEAQEAVQDQIRAEMTSMREKLRRGEIDDLQKPENRTPRLRELEAQFDELVKKQRENVVKDELDEIYTKNGAEGLNAQTNEDFTWYFVRLPRNRIELWAWLESDRLMNRVFREFYSERDVVYEERRRSVESTPLGKYDEAFNAAFWEAHPYKWPVLGWPSDLAAITKAQADEYYSLYYSPQNVTGVLAGDFETEAVWPTIVRYFGRIPRGKAKPPEMVTLEPPPVGEKRFDATAETSPTVRVWWHAAPFVHRDRAPLEALDALLSGRTGRLYKGLVLGRKVANQVSSSYDIRKYSGIFEIEATVKDGVEPAQVERAISEEVEALQKATPPPEELQKVKNETKAASYRRLVSPFYVGFQLILYDALGDWHQINTWGASMDAVTGEDIQRVAKAYLGKDTRTVGTFLRAEGAAAPDPTLASLPENVRAVVAQGVARIESETEPKALRDGIAQMQERAAHVAPEMKAAIDLMIRKAEERLAALEKAKK